MFFFGGGRGRAGREEEEEEGRVAVELHLKSGTCLNLCSSRLSRSVSWR